ncbi:MAG: ImmA/IrrE family metallo-endopeptidase [Anaerorhabdus sp.]|uniref:ImmA/IrrE family metallo-endopeptidase n=1 Tax=Anaerorhabdus sp. TaxID=1872524 RepID=UPI002FCB6E2B
MDDLLEFAEINNYQVFFNEIEDIKSISLEYNNKLFINIDESKFDTEREKRVCLAHEIGHCISGTLYTINHSNLYRGSAEYRADYRAAKLVIPINQLKECIVNGIIEKYEIAEYFNITEEFVDRVLYIYRNKGLI